MCCMDMRLWIRHYPSPEKSMRNPLRDSQRATEANRARTIKRVERYYGKLALLQTWESEPMATRGANHEYIVGLTKTVRQERAYHRIADGQRRLFSQPIVAMLPVHASPKGDQEGAVAHVTRRRLRPYFNENPTGHN